MADTEGATPNERLLAAAKSDNEEMLNAVLSETGKFDINYQDGLGNTALHYAASYGSTDVLDPLLEEDGCDVDIQNRLMKATPLHLAVKIPDLETRVYVVRSLLDAGADVQLRDKNGQTPLDLVSPNDSEIRKYFREAQEQASVAQADIASDDDDAAVDPNDVASDSD